jgi:hypothetical protein
MVTAVIAVIFVMFLVAVADTVHRRREFDRALTQATSALSSALFVESGPGSPREIRLDATVKRIPLTLRIFLTQRAFGYRDVNRTRLEIVWPVAVGRLPTLEIRRATWLDGIGRALGWIDRAVGDPSFDRLFTVTSSASRDAISRLVPIELRNVLFRFHREGQRVSLSSNRSRWCLELDTWPDSTFLYLLLTDAAWASSEALLPDEPVAMLPPPPAGRGHGLLLRSPEGATLQLLPPDASPRGRPRREPICQVCGQSLDGIVMACNSCDSLHHEDCWTYTGRCATFGCGSTASRPIHAHG